MPQFIWNTAALEGNTFTYARKLEFNNALDTLFLENNATMLVHFLISCLERIVLSCSSVLPSNLSIRSIAKRAVVSPQTVSRFLQEPESLTVGNFKKIAATMEKTIDLIESPLYDPQALVAAQHILYAEPAGTSGF